MRLDLTKTLMRHSNRKCIKRLAAN